MYINVRFKKYCMPPVRFELTTPDLRDQCSTTELKNLVNTVSLKNFIATQQGSTVRTADCVRVGAFMSRQKNILITPKIAYWTQCSFPCSFSVKYTKLFEPTTHTKQKLTFDFDPQKTFTFSTLW